MADTTRKIRLRDSTLREGLDTPGVTFLPDQRLKIAKLLEASGVPEVEIVAPSRVIQDLKFARLLRDETPRLTTSGLIYCSAPNARVQIRAASEALGRFDLLMPVSEKREPATKVAKIELLEEVLNFSLSCHSEVGVGFPHSLQVDVEFLVEISHAAVEAGAKRVTIYDTNGGADPFALRGVISRLRGEHGVEIFFHGHNDFGLATANAFAAVLGGADGLDVTVNGLGDRAGNASLEQVALLLHVRGFETGIELKNLRKLSEMLATESGVAVSSLAPIVGQFVVCHKSPSHLEDPSLFEAFDPALVAAERKFDR
jgi:homocitrate synthase NifV